MKASPILRGAFSVCPTLPATRRPKARVDRYETKLERVESTRGSSPRSGTQIYRLPTGVEVLLPAGDDAFDRWIDQIEASATFPGQEAAIAEIRRTPTTLAVPDDRPIVGVVTCEPSHLLRDHEGAARRTIAVIEANGCRPVLIPPRANLAVRDPETRSREVAESLVARLDGLIGLGGADVHPFLYGKRKTHAIDTNLPRDRFEATLIHAALDAPVAMLGICRSHQLWNAITGGDLVQDIQREGYTASPRDQRLFGVPMSQAPYVTDVDEGTRLRRIVGRSSIRTNAAHHQAVRRVGRGFRKVAHTTDPVLGVRLIQATENEHAITVQFHPELLDDNEPARALLDATCRRAMIFAFARASEQPTVHEIIARMKREPEFTPDDYRWVREDVPKILRAGGCAA